MIKKLILSSFLYFLPLQAQQVSLIDNKGFETKGDSLELKVRDYHNFGGSKGYLEAKAKNLSVYLNKLGVLNHSFGAEQKNVFFNFKREHTRTGNSQSGVSSTIIDKKQVYDMGFNYPLFEKIGLELGFERASSKQEIDATILFLMGDTAISSLDSWLNQNSSMLEIKSKYFSIKGIYNNINNKTIQRKSDGTIDISTINESSADTIFSITPIKNINYTYDGKHHGYFTSHTDPVNVFIDFDMVYPKESKFIFETGNYKDHEIKRFEYEIENQNRFVDGLYDIDYEKDLRFFGDVYMNEGPEISFKKLKNFSVSPSFRWKIQEGKKSVAEFNYKHKIKKINILKV